MSQSQKSDIQEPTTKGEIFSMVIPPGMQSQASMAIAKLWANYNRKRGLYVTRQEFRQMHVQKPKKDVSKLIAEGMALKGIAKATTSPTLRRKALLKAEEKFAEATDSSSSDEDVETEARAIQVDKALAMEVRAMKVQQLTPQVAPTVVKTKTRTTATGHSKVESEETKTLPVPTVVNPVAAEGLKLARSTLKPAPPSRRSSTMNPRLGLGDPHREKDSSETSFEKVCLAIRERNKKHGGRPRVVVHTATCPLEHHRRGIDPCPCAFTRS